MLKLICLMMIGITGTWNAFGQRNDSILIKMSGDPYIVNSSGEILSLDKAMATMNKYKKGDKTQTMSIDQEHASVILSASDSIRLGIQASADLNMIEPTMIFHIYRLHTTNGKREIILESTPTKGKKASNERIAYLHNKSGDKIFFTIPDKLAPGEYAFINMLKMKKDYSVPAFCFRIE